MLERYPPTAALGVYVPRAVLEEYPATAAVEECLPTAIVEDQQQW